MKFKATAQELLSPKFFDPAIFTGKKPYAERYFTDNTSMDDLIDFVNKTRYNVGVSSNLEGFVWATQAAYNTNPSSQLTYSEYDDSKAAMTVMLTPGHITSLDQDIAKVFAKEDMCTQLKGTLSTKLGITFEPYWVSFDGSPQPSAPGDERTPQNKSFMSSCFKDGTVNHYDAKADLSDASAEKASEALYQAILKLGNSVS